MPKTIYVCEGTCEGVLEPTASFKEEAKCEATECTKFDQPLTKMLVCDDCFKRYHEGEEHTCS